MIQERQNEQLIEMYLLGDLSQPEREQVEARYFTEPDFLERMDAVEEELITDYLRGALSEEKARKLQEHLLTSPYQMEKVKFARTLLRSIDEIGAKQVAVAPFAPARENWWDAARGFFSFRGRWELAAAAAALLLVSGLVIEIIRLRQQLEKARQEHTALLKQKQDLQNTITQQKEVIVRLTGQPQIPPQDKKDEPKKEITPPPPKTHFATFISRLLFSGARAGQGDTQELVFSRGFETVRLRLFYEGESRPPFRAVLENADREQLWPKDGLPPKYDLPASKFGKGKRIDVELPASLFEDRTYTLVLKVKTSSGEKDVSHYNFTVRRK